ILPVEQFKQQYGTRITPLGGLDVDRICRDTPEELRRYTRAKIEQCFAADGWWALGTGNSLTDYMPVENYLTVLEEGVRIVG
ncbi:MAG TPA: uroporphyrinogen-III decarboxylase-like protein, partial [Armatimonadota bacterium]|nr:uroporphyrinogen-III decarboxylase-like protein [Armatimonadota bacterium]